MAIKSKLPLGGVFIFFVWSAQPAYAYLDPGTGTIIIQSIIGGIAAGTTFLAIYWSKFKGFVARVRGKLPDEKDSQSEESNEK